MQKLILLNPPYHRTLIRDYSCSHFSKGSYQWAPVDLVVLSANLQDYFDVHYFDLIRDRTLIQELFSEIQNADILISLVSYISIIEDLALLESLHKINDKLKIYILGDIVSFDGDKILEENGFLCGRIADFTEIDINKLIIGQEDICQYGTDSSMFSIRPQNSQLFSKYNYAMPYSRYSNVATVLALNYGCKFHCTFCNSNKLTYKRRSVGETVAELRSLEEQGIKEVYFRDFTLNAEPEVLADLCDQITKKNIRILWSCDARLDLLSETLLKKMKRAGCYLVFFGIETNNKMIAQNAGKPIDDNQLNKILNICKKEKILTLGSFLFGLPHESKESVEQTIQYALGLSLSYASFNVFERRPGLDHAFDEQVLTVEELMGYQSSANRRFYFRIKKMLELIANIRTVSQLNNCIKNGLKLLLC